MGKSYDPFQKDELKEGFTPLSYWDNLPKHSMLRMFGGVDLGANGHEVLDLLNPLDLEKLSVGDDVYFGNSKGVITEVYKTKSEDGVIDLGYKELPVGSVVGMSVKRYLNYLRPEDRVAPTAKGYDAAGDGITMSCFFYQGVYLARYKQGGGALFMYPGNIYISRRNKGRSFGPGESGGTLAGYRGAVSFPPPATQSGYYGDIDVVIAVPANTNIGVNYYLNTGDNFTVPDRTFSLQLTNSLPFPLSMLTHIGEDSKENYIAVPAGTAGGDYTGVLTCTFTDLETGEEFVTTVNVTIIVTINK